MDTESKRSTCGSCNVVGLDERRASVSRKTTSRPGVRVMVEVACNEPVGEDIRSNLSKQLEDLGHLVVSDHQPDWVFSLIAFQHGSLVELSVVLRKFFRSTAPGTESIGPDSSDDGQLREGAWIYESLRFHGLFGVERKDLDRLLGNLARDFGRQSNSKKRASEQ